MIAQPFSNNYSLFFFQLQTNSRTQEIDKLAKPSAISSAISSTKSSPVSCASLSSVSNISVAASVVTSIATTIDDIGTNTLATSGDDLYINSKVTSVDDIYSNGHVKELKSSIDKLGIQGDQLNSWFTNIYSFDKKHQEFVLVENNLEPNRLEVQKL